MNAPWVKLKFKNSVFVQNSSSSLYSNFIWSLYIVFEWNDWPRFPTNSFTIENCLFGTVKLTRNVDKSRFTYNGWGMAILKKVCGVLEMALLEMF